MKRILFTLGLVVIAAFSAASQSLSNVRYEEMLRKDVRREINLPDISGFLTLKCDFHIHTVFSDGSVWPNVRVQEAWRDGLDVISITDHIEYRPHKDFVGGHFNTSYELAERVAASKNLILIRGAEITRSMPPGHLNALFIKDANLLEVKEVDDALRAAKDQGAFLIWNHPGWKAQQPDTCRWMPKHQELFEKGLIDGVEIFNEVEYYPVVLDWCREKNLTVFANTDIHEPTNWTYNLDEVIRPMTLVFAKERTTESIREAMVARRTVAFFNNRLAGPENLLAALFRESIVITRLNPEGSQYQIRNKSDIPFTIRISGKKNIEIPAGSSVLARLEPGDLSGVEVLNLYTGSKSCLKVESIASWIQ